MAINSDEILGEEFMFLSKKFVAGETESVIKEVT